MSIESQEVYNIKIPVFEGPLDLLLHLIKENKIDIYDIPIALITRQYLEYLELMKELNLEIASEFLVMAATLIYIKSRMLLPADEIDKEVDEEDPRIELVEKLLEYQAFKEAALGLKEREEEWSYVLTRQSYDPEEEYGYEELYLFDINIYDLLGALKRILERLPPETVRITRDTLTVKDRISYILEIMDKKDNLRFDDLFEGIYTKSEVIVTFLAILELLRLGILRAYQERHLGTIWLMKKNAETSTA